MIKFLANKTVAGIRYGKGTVVSFDPVIEGQLIAAGDAEADTIDKSHPYYFFHGYAGNQFAGDSLFFDLAAGNHGVRGGNLSDSEMFATAGMVTTNAESIFPSTQYPYVLLAPSRTSAISCTPPSNGTALLSAPALAVAPYTAIASLPD